MLSDYKYAIGTTKHADNYSNIATYLILHIRKTYKQGRDIADAIAKQEPFNFEPSAPRLKISSSVEMEDTTPQEKLDIKHGNDQYKIQFEEELQLHLKQTRSLSLQPGESICILIWAMHDRPTA